MRYVGHLAFFVYGLAGFAIEMDMLRKSSKTTTMLRPHLCIDMPTFDDAHTIRVHPTRYVLVAGIYHLGECPDAGHYRAFVSGFSERNKKKFHVFDDNVQAVIATESDVQTLCRNCYLLYFVQRHS